MLKRKQRLNRRKGGTLAWTRSEWAPKKWNDGYINNRGRMMVYSPNCSRHGKDGYTFRSWAVWEAHKGKIPKGYDIHHKDRNRLNDKIENLDLLKHSEHSKLHNRKIWKNFVCKNCGVIFKRDGHYGARKYKYCSRKCFQLGYRKAR